MREMKDSGVEWLGEVPAGWGVVPGKRILVLLQRPVEDDDGVITCFRDGEVTLRVHRRIDGFTVALKEIGYQGIKPGDLVVHGMDGFAGSIGISDSRGKASPVLNVMDSDQNKRFLMYYMRGLAYRDVYMALSDGIRVRSCNLSWKKIANLLFALPPLPEQRRIAGYLDEKCAEIDRAVSAAEQTIEEYKAYKNSVVYRAVTKGLDADAPMKDSGVEWLCEVPVGWGLRQVGQLADQTKTPNKGMVESNLLSLSYGKIKRRDIYATDGLLPASFETYNIIEPDDIVFRFTDLQNDQKSLRVGRVTERGIITSAYVTVRPFDPSCSRFLYYALHAYDLRKGFYGMGAGVRQGLKWQEAKYIKLPWPGNVDRGRIADYLDEKCSQIDTAIAAKQAIIADLKAYKQSLIYETVTGKREV
ncbi:restriction endonuclease subunit S domain-containing protein [Olegusella massiliensis]|uniref:restriction endonuclease subunit S n=1 Tax=Olegusella massiliensis TaxID=1776381 RepID=UPI0009EF0F11|nr:restriction endonuclease subunit S [Olegusella massiliensis]